MDVPLLVEGIVRRTMVLIAQLSTASGQRAPLSGVADQVFLSLVEELERQRLGKKIIADMFGLALRSYQQKVQRLSESVTDRGRTLWSAVFEHLRSVGVATKVDVLERFARDDDASVRGILADLVDSGLVYQSGRGDAALFRVTDVEDWSRVATGDEGRALVAWLLLYREGPAMLSDLAERLRLDEPGVQSLLAPLVTDGRVEIVEGDGVRRYTTTGCVIPLGAAAGFEAAILDHFGAVAAALAAKVRFGARKSSAADATGGSTFTFELEPGHRLEEEVRGMLARARADAIALWERVAEENARKPIRDAGYRVTFYVGQHVQGEIADEQET